MGPMLQMALRALGIDPSAPGGRDKTLSDAETKALGLPPAAPAGTVAPMIQGQRPAQLTPEQQSDAYAVGTGAMKAYEFQRKHGFLP